MWKLRCDLSLGDIVGHIAIWLIIGVCTCGIAFFLFPYSFGETVINSTRLIDEHGRVIGRLKCTQSGTTQIGHAILWWFLSVITLGVAWFFYTYRIASDLLTATVVEPAR